MGYSFLEDIATADIAFKAWGKDLSEVFQAAAEATMNVMIEDLDSIHPTEKKEIIIENEALDMLLFDLLQELIYYKDSNQLLLRIKEAQVEEIPGRYRLKA